MNQSTCPPKVPTSFGCSLSNRTPTNPTEKKAFLTWASMEQPLMSVSPAPPPSAVRVTISVRKKAFLAILWGEGVEVLGRATKFGGELRGTLLRQPPKF